jgi:hypothetical protein
VAVRWRLRPEMMLPLDSATPIPRKWFIDVLRLSVMNFMYFAKI